MGPPDALGTRVAVTPPMSRTRATIVRLGEREFRVEVEPDLTVTIVPGEQRAQITRLTADTYRVVTASRAWHVVVAASGSRVQVVADGHVFDLEVGSTPSRTRGAMRHDGNALAAPMPARVREVLVKEGQSVAAGDVLVTLEAMTMELAVRAPRDGRVVSIACRPGELVSQGVPLLELEGTA